MPVGFETGVRIHRRMQLIAGEAVPVAGYLASTEEPWTANASRRTGGVAWASVLSPQPFSR
jgi:hypothetical protein